MKNLFIGIFFTLQAITITVKAQNIAINMDGSLPDASAMLDIAGTTKGFLAPRMTSGQQSLIVLPAKGLLIYNLTDNLFRVNTGTPGTPVWTALGAGTNNWLLTGNSGTVASTNFLGNVDNVDLVFRTSNLQRMVIDAQGRVGIGVTNPANPLVVKDILEIRRVGAVSQLLFSGTAGSGDFRIAGDGGDIFWQGGGSRNLQMGSFWGITLMGDRQNAALPGFAGGVANTSVLVQAQRDVSVPLAIQGNSATQSANLTEWRTSAGTVLNMIDKNGNISIGGTAFNGANPEKLLVDASATTSVNAIAGKGNINNYLQLNIQNNSAGSNASSDVVATANNGDETTNYVDMGINSSGNTSDIMGTANDAYLYNIGQHFFIGTGAIGKSLMFLTGGTDSASNERMRIDGIGNVGIGVPAPDALLHLKAGTAAASTAPLKLTAGINLTTPEAGAVEFNGTHFYGTVGNTRYQLDQQSSFTGSLAGDVTGTQAATIVGKINGTSLAGLGTGILKNTTGTGVPSIAVAADFPILNQNTTGRAATVTTNANLTGEVTSVGNATTITNNAVTGKVLTGFVSGAGNVTATDNILQAIQKLNGNDASKAPIASPTFTGLPLAPTATAGTNTTQIATTGFVSAAVNASASTFTGNLAGDVTGTQAATVVGKINGTSLSGLGTGILKNTTGTGVPSIATAADFPILNQNTTGTAANVVTNANLSGEVTSIGNATTIINNAVTGKVLTGFVSGAGNVTATDNILQAIQKLNGNDASKAPIASPTFTGLPLAPTATAGTNTTQIATTGFVTAAVSASAGSFTGSLAGDVNGTQAATVVKRINGISLAGLTTGILKNTTTTGIPSIAVAADFPILNQNTTGTAANVTGTIGAINGGTGLTAVVTGDLLYGSAANTWGKLAAGTNNEILTLVGGIPSWERNPGVTAWSLSGNTVTPGSQFLGSQNNISLRMRTNNLERMVVDSFGNIGMGTTAPTQKLDISGNLRLSGAFMPNNNAGSTGFLLQSNGAGVAPSWIDASGYLALLAWAPGGNSVSSSRSIGTISNFDLPFITNNTEKMRLSKTGEFAIGTATFNGTNPEQLLVDAGTTTSINAIVGRGSINNYLQLNIQNTSGGGSASSDVVATADNGSETANYVDMGINGSGNNSGIMGTANDAYLYNLGQNFMIGTGSPGKTLLFLTGGTDSAINERMRIDGAGNVGIGNETPNSTLSVTGSLSVSFRSGTGAYTLLNTDYVVINTGGSTPTWTLPAPNSCRGRVYKLINQGSTNVTLSRPVTTGNGTTSTSLGSTAGTNNYEIISDGTLWRKMN